MIKKIILVIFFLGILLRLFTAIKNPIYNAPDEKTHFNYIHTLYSTHTLPVRIDNKDSDQSSFFYPPVYYILNLPLYSLSRFLFPENLLLAFISIRLCSIIMWIIAFILTHRLFITLKVTSLFLTIFSLSILSFLPTYVFLSSSINPDNLLALWGGVVLSLLVRKDSFKNFIFIGLICGLAVTTKYTGAYLILFVLLYLIVLRINKKVSTLLCIRYILPSFFLPALFFIPFALHNSHVYGSVTGMGSIAYFKPAYIFLIDRAFWYFNVSFWAVSGIYNNIVFLPVVSKYITLSLLFLFTGGIIYKRNYFIRLANQNVFPLILSGLLSIFIISLSVIYTGIRYATLGGPGGQGRYIYLFLIPFSFITAIILRAYIPAKRELSVSLFFLALFIVYAFVFIFYSISIFI